MFGKTVCILLICNNHYSALLNSEQKSWALKNTFACTLISQKCYLYSCQNAWQVKQIQSFFFKVQFTEQAFGRMEKKEIIQYFQCTITIFTQLEFFSQLTIRTQQRMHCTVFLSDLQAPAGILKIQDGTFRILLNMRIKKKIRNYKNFS